MQRFGLISRKKYFLFIFTFLSSNILVLQLNAQWELTYSINGGTVNSMIVKDKFIFAGTSTAGIFRSTDNGGNWIQVDSGMLGAVSITSFALNSSGIFAGSTGGVYFSPDNGNNWTPVNSGLGKTGIKAMAVKDNDVYAGCLLAGVFKTTNNGANWTRFVLGEGDLLLTVFANGPDFYVSILGTLLRSTNNGMSWESAGNGLTNNNVLTLSANGINLFAGTEGGVFHSTNKGDLWNPVNNGMSDSLIQVLLNKDANVFAGTSSGGLFLSTNNGLLWTSVNTGLTDTNIKSLTYTGTHIFAGSQSGKIWKRPLSELITGIKANHNIIASHFILHQNFPNPFNPSTTISFSLPTRSFVDLKIYDVMGKEVSKLVSENLSAGSYSINWNSGNLAGGIYFCTLHAGTFFETKKLILIK